MKKFIIILTIIAISLCVFTACKEETPQPKYDLVYQLGEFGNLEPAVSATFEELYELSDRARVFSITLDDSVKDITEKDFTVFNNLYRFSIPAGLTINIDTQLRSKSGWNWVVSQNMAKQTGEKTYTEETVLGFNNP